jgi:hypothetical protein
MQQENSKVSRFSLKDLRSAQATIPFFVRDERGKSTALRLPLHTTVTQLKIEIEHRLGLPANLQTLKTGYKTLQDQHSLEEMDLQPNVTIEILIGLDGDMTLTPPPTPTKKNTESTIYELGHRSRATAIACCGILSEDVYS